MREVLFVRRRLPAGPLRGRAAPPPLRQLPALGLQQLRVVLRPLPLPQRLRGVPAGAARAAMEPPQRGFRQPK